MPDNLRPYTVSAVVNTDTGDLVGTPIVRAGHEDYARFDTVKPLTAAEQFRWVHVWAPDSAAAAVTDALTVDLRAGGDRIPPVARALTGDGGLKPYTVSAVVSRRHNRPLGPVSVLAGHPPVGEATGPPPPGSRDLVAPVWARDRRDAVTQIFGTHRNIDGEAGWRATGPDESEPPDQPRPDEARPDQTGVVTLETAVAHREWIRLADMPADARAALVADTVWNRHYPTTYQSAYMNAASQIAAQATAASDRNPTARTTLHELAMAAGTAISQLPTELPAAPPANHHTVTAAQAAAATPNQQPPWQRIADLATAGSHVAATLAGTLTATADILTRWRSRTGRRSDTGQVLAHELPVDGQPARTWVGNLLAAVNRDAANRIAANGIAATDGAAMPTRERTAAQLAREDQAAGVASTTRGVVSSRARSTASSASSPTTTRRTR